MSVIAEFTLSHPGLPMMDALEGTGVEFDVEHAAASDPDRPVLFLWATGGDFDRFEANCEDDDTVADLSVVEDTGDRRLYRVQVSAATDLALYPLDDRLEASRLGVTSGEEGLHVRMRFPDRESLSAFRPQLEAKGVDATLRRVYGENDPDFGGEHGLSPKQREALETAVEAGFFEVPRDATLSDVADELGVSTQAASERLRRGVSTFVRTNFD
ncbi:helix-turn-helix domain-containing protein [Halobacterium litoreum]|uniref:Helix-turn-helix domain-containing protein n=1 Tax=Halobacterium litoreum TaxID=2039234 RepID=A0ABD5NHZ2_9EURY|nr:helix-turn-helix domain-containing protein [Halobacterium litoreum]UHH12259.1 helix-turn-helix domain-containing protein [Halobacterium litoreum]